MLRSSSVTIRNCMVSPWLSHGKATARSSVQLRTRRGTFGVRSAMPTVRAERFVLKQSSSLPISHATGQFRKCAGDLHRHTDLIEPLSLDEAYLDVTENKTELPTATFVARTIREQIRQELNLTASAGVAQNKFLAKLASDWRKPDGLFVIQPEDVDAFLLPLPVGRLPGVGKVTGEKLAKLGITDCEPNYENGNCRLEEHSDAMVCVCYELARGIDDHQVIPDRPTKSISVEDTFEQDVLLRKPRP